MTNAQTNTPATILVVRQGIEDAVERLANLGVGNDLLLPILEWSRRPSPTPDVQTPSDAKLRKDAENVLTWSAPTDGDPLEFAHFQRFAREIIRLLDLVSAPLSGTNP